jgi:WD40 repeat protein/DNA-binding SARP family transcriptional activator/energy-coupling factor transporter ATP-binding protein EcfA2
MGIAVLGPLQVDEGTDALARRDRVVLAVLAMRVGELVSAEQLADALWTEGPPPTWHKALQGSVVRLRKLLGAATIETVDHGYRLTLSASEVDAHEFERLVGRARELMELGAPERAAYLLGEALGLWRGSALPDLEEWEPGRSEADRLDELRRDAEELRVDALVRSGRHGEVLVEARRQVEASPLRERRWELLALAQYRCGQQADALRSLRQLRRVLATELGLDAGPYVLALEQAMLRQDPDLLPLITVAEPSETCPYLGLVPYGVGDAETFFGREAEVEACRHRLASAGVLAVVGPSGSGKSSLVRAGLAAALERDGERVVVVTPGRHPLAALSAVPPRGPPVVLVVDQAEEAVSLCEDLAEVTQFFEALAARVTGHATGGGLVLALRADRLGDLVGYGRMARLVEQGLYLLTPMSAESLRAAIEGPARQAGLRLEAGLVELLASEVEGQPGALPLLSHALRQTWERREGGVLTLDGYRATGGIRQAVAQSAERVYHELPVEQRTMLRDVMLRLVSPSPEGAPVRSRVPRRSLSTDPDHEQLMERLVAARLVTIDDGVAELAHEAIARAWPRLQGWLDDDVDGQRILHHLTATADGWDALGRPETELYRGVRLARALGLQDQRHASLNAIETDFLAASREAEQVAERSAAEHARRQAVLIRRLRLVLAGAVVLLGFALGAGGYAVVQSDRAARNADEARHTAVSADARRVGTRSQLTEDISLSLLLAAAGARLDDSPETRVNLLAALGKQPHLVRSAPPGGGYVEVMDVSPDGRWIASSDDQNRMHLYDATTNRLLRSYDAGRPPEDELASILGAFSPDSSHLAVLPWSVESTDPVRLLDPDTMELSATRLATPAAEPVSGVDVGFSADGRYLATTMLTLPLVKDDPWSTPGYAAVWDLRSPSTPPVRVSTGTGGFQSLALSPDGQTLYTGWPLTAYDVASGDTIWREPEVLAPLLEVNASGTLLALVDDDTSVKDVLLVDTATGDTVDTLRGHRDVVRDIRFSPDGSLVGAAPGDYELIVWDTATGRLRERWDIFDDWGVGFSPDNDLVYGGGGGGSGGSEPMLRTWDLSSADTYLQKTTQVDDAEVFTHADISPDGQRVAYSWLDDEKRGWIRFVDAVSGDATAPVRFPVWDVLFWVNAVDAWHPDGGQYVGFWCDGVEACARPGRMTVLDSVTGRPLRKPRDIVEGDGDLKSLAYVDEGRSLLAVDSEDQILVLDTETLRPRGEPLDVLDGHFPNGNCCTTSIGDGSTAMVYEWDGAGETTRWRVVDFGDGDVLSEGDVDLFAQASVASPEGSTVAVAGDTGQIVTIDVPTGAEQRRSADLGSVVLWLEYSDDGELLVSGANDGGVSLWDAATLDLLGTVYPPHRGEAVPAGAQFIGESHDVAIASYDGHVYRWETDPARAIDFACRMAGRNLTEAEWAEFLPAQPYREVCPGL